jgi:uncharacterized protein YbjT (DUF2867 family)
MTNNILVTGATSNISTAIIKQLVSDGQSVRALVRDSKKAENLKDLGVELRIGDLEKPVTLNQVFSGIDTAFILTAPTPRAPEQFSNALWAARQAGVKRIVRLSAFGAEHNAPTINSRLHALSDSELVASGMTYTIIKPHFFMQNLSMAIKNSVDEGVLRFSLGDGKLALIHTNDIAEFAAKILTTNKHDNVVYTITGPESISLYEVASEVSSIIHKTIKYEPATVEQFLEVMANMGIDDFTLNLLRDYLNAYSNNWGDIVSNDFSKIMGKPARNISTFLSELLM